jgi:hypothetical protein
MDHISSWSVLIVVIDWVKLHTIKTQKLRLVGLEVNTEKTKYIFISCHQNVGQNHILLITNKFKHLGTAVTNQNHIHEELKSS